MDEFITYSNLYPQLIWHDVILDTFRNFVGFVLGTFLLYYICTLTRAPAIIFERVVILSCVYINFAIFSALPVLTTG